jgi:hypothetical protein
MSNQEPDQLPHSDMPNADEVVAILTQLREEIRTRRAALVANDRHRETNRALDRELQQCLEQLEITRVVSAHWPLESRSLVQRAVNFVNKVVRRLLRWYINPIVEQQNEFNDVTARTLRLLVEGYEDVRNQAAAVERTMESQPESGVESNDDNQRHNPPNQRQNAPSHPPHSPSASLKRDVTPIDDSVDNEIRYEMLQRLVEERGAEEPPAAFPDRTLRTYLPHLRYHQAVNAHWELGGPTVVERLSAVVHKGMRFGLRWLINPIVEQQNSFNNAATRMIETLLTTDSEMRARLASQRARTIQKSHQQSIKQSISD